MLYGLAYIPEEDVFEVWELVVGFCRSDPQRSVAKYFGDTYVARLAAQSARRPRYVEARYPPKTWNLNHTLNSDSPHTNNPVEGNHNKISFLVNKKNPTFWDYIKCIKKLERKSEQAITHLTMNQIFSDIVPAARQRKAAIKAKLENYNDDNKLETLKAIAMILDE